MFISFCELPMPFHLNIISKELRVANILGLALCLSRCLCVIIFRICFNVIHIIKDVSNYRALKRLQRKHFPNINMFIKRINTVLPQLLFPKSLHTDHESLSVDLAVIILFLSLQNCSFLSCYKILSRSSLPQQKRS